MEKERELKIQQIKDDTILYIKRNGIPPYVFRLLPYELSLIGNTTKISVEYDNKTIQVSLALLL